MFFVRYPDGSAIGTRWYSKAGCEREVAKVKADPHQKGARPYCELSVGFGREKEIS
jgi:hypothetical protein